MTCRIDTEGNRVLIAGSFSLTDLRRLTATLHNLTTRLGYQDVVLDMTRCIAAYPGPMVGLCSQVASLRDSGVDFELLIPSDARLDRLFHGANWGHHIDPGHYKSSTYRGYTHVPVARYHTHEEQPRIVNRMIDALLCSISGIERSDLAAIEWSLNEVTDNVLVHAESHVGGFAQLNNYKSKRRVEFCVADAGAGIPNTLRHRFPILEDIELLEQAVREGVTRDPTIGQGNGLFGTFQVARTSEGYLHILSGFATLSFENGQLRITREKIPYTGTLVIAGLDCSNPTALGDALRFGDSKYVPTDYIELKYVDRASEDIVFRMKEETLSCGSRVAGSPVRTKLTTLISMHGGRRIVVDMSEIAIVSSSFADEVFGKLFKELGPLKFMQAVDIRGVSGTVRSLIDRAIVQRSQG
jgi:hypothetical protein